MSSTDTENRMNKHNPATLLPVTVM